jgi:hypothetical protein
MADKKAESYPSDPSTRPVIDLLTTILEEFRKQVQSGTIPPLEGNAEIAVKAFREISEALDVKPATTAVRA